MTTEWKLFINFCLKSAFQPRFTYIMAKFDKNRPLQSCRKVVWYCWQKTPNVRDTSEPPISPPLSRSRPKFHEHCQPLSCACNRLWSGSAAVCRNYYGKSPKKSIQYRLSAYTITQYSIPPNVEPLLTAYSEEDMTLCSRFITTPSSPRANQPALFSSRRPGDPVYTHTAVT